MAGLVGLLSSVPLWVFTLVLLVVNGATLLLFRHDKQAALAGARRVPERRLLKLAAIGGTPAAFAARRLFRHKTRKQPFSSRLELIALLQAMAVTFVVVFVSI
jgi:uncharacterized membrane protein YsdA (DUF1294 family)